MSELFNWGRDFYTGVNIIDEQHKMLVEIINGAVHMSVSDSKITQDEINSLKENLIYYVGNHFSTEAEMMEKYKIDSRHSKAHLSAHNDFENRVKAFFDNKNISIDKAQLNDFLIYLIRWLVYHILNVDKSLVRQCESIRGGGDPKTVFENEQNYIEEHTEPLLKALRELFYIISKKNKELEKYNKTLEEEVHKRTKELESLNEKLEALSMSDELTGLPNRRFAMLTLEKYIKSWERYKNVFSLVFIDVDKFKQVNDTYGHDYGDKVLIWISDFLKDNLRESDIVCRLGGDEFLVVCPNSNGEDAKKACQLLIEKYKEINANNPLAYWTISLSMGIIEVTQKEATIDTMLQKADKAMYDAKRKGGGRLILI